MTLTVDLTGQRHKVARVTADPRVVITERGIRVALVGSGHPKPTWCGSCAK